MLMILLFIVRQTAYGTPIYGHRSATSVNRVFKKMLNFFLMCNCVTFTRVNNVSGLFSKG
jgi:hypothetical protein